MYGACRFCLEIKIALNVFTVYSFVEGVLMLTKWQMQ